MKYVIGFLAAVMFVMAFQEAQYGEGWQRKCTAAIAANQSGKGGEQ